MWEPTQYSVTPVATMLARCVARGILSQEDIDLAPKETCTFSSHLQEVEQQMESKRCLNELQLEMDLLKLEKESANVTHKFYLSQRFVALQEFSSHLQEVLREQTTLKQRLMKPFCQNNLQIHADLHRCVVDLMKMMVDFIETLEKHMTTVRTIPTVGDNMVKLNNALTELLVQTTEVKKLSEQLLQWRDCTSVKRRNPQLQ